MQHIPVRSSNVLSIGYDLSTNTLEICYRSGGTYQYLNVPSSVYNNLMNAYSKGGYLADFIKPFYRYRKVR